MGVVVGRHTLPTVEIEPPTWDGTQRMATFASGRDPAAISRELLGALPPGGSQFDSLSITRCEDGRFTGVLYWTNRYL